MLLNLMILIGDKEHAAVDYRAKGSANVAR